MKNNPCSSFRKLLLIVLILTSASTLIANEIEHQYLFEKNLSALFSQSDFVHSRNRGDYKTTTFQRPSEFVDDSDTGYQHRPNSTVRHITKTKGIVIYDSIYHFDKWGHRVNLSPPSPEQNQFLLFYGCSNTYGNGLNTEDSINNLYNSLPGKYYSYNLAIGASGPHMLLAKLLSYKKTPPDFSPFKTGKMIYFYHNDHLRRTNGLKYQSKGLNKSPYYNFINNNIPKKVGSIGVTHSFKHKFYKWVNNLFKILKLNYTFPKVNNSHIQYFCKILKASKKEFKTIWPDSDFLIVQHTFSKKPPELLRLCLKEDNIKILTPSFKTNSNDFIPIDGHPNKKYNEKLARYLLNLDQ